MQIIISSVLNHMQVTKALLTYDITWNLISVQLFDLIFQVGGIVGGIPDCFQ